MVQITSRWGFGVGLPCRLLFKNKSMLKQKENSCAVEFCNVDLACSKVRALFLLRVVQILRRFSNGFVAECHVELSERQVSGSARLHVHGGGPAHAAAVSRVTRGERRRERRPGWGSVRKREDQERTDLVLWNLRLFLLRLVCFPKAESRVRALRLLLQAVRAATVPQGGAEGNHDGGVPAVAVVRVGEVGGAEHGCS